MKTKQQISYNMSRVRSSGSKIERTLAVAMWSAGIRYRKQYAKVPGKPDFALVSKKIAVFCDSSFWHGRDFEVASQKFRTNRDFWIAKIQRNIARDEQVGSLLRGMGWTVLRFWDSEILTNPDGCVRAVQDAIISAQRLRDNDETIPNSSS